MSRRAIAVEFDLVSALGPDAETTWGALVTGQSGVRPFARFPAGPARPSNAAFVDGLEPGHGDTLVVQMLRPVLERHRHAIPSDAQLLLATTNGEIEYLERAVAGEPASAKDSVPTVLATKVQALVGLERPGVVVSAACASSTVAIAEGAAMIRAGEAESVLIVACDFVSEFVAAGFRSLGALAPDRARPFDRDRRGLSLGEAAGFLLLMDEHRARAEARTCHAEIAGWGVSSDADHITAPSATGQGLATAIRKALATASVDPRNVGSICAHGTGTRPNDAMELQAFARVFADAVPTYSVKGAVGHTMGTAGLVDAIVAVQSLTVGTAPPTAGLLEPDTDALTWVSASPQSCSPMVALSTNSGFGGVNSALVLRRCEAPR
ncbi:MAG: beta-ketoacyl-[acyl-carrier-protein] synthase family protein [Deltaproteobacteria bacterium]|nr:beta-ketoacyl-[acyl-carrier-protein] synthase family protein [Deltaproteobacteria bacterium]MBM4268535.1 beta-ketoacyl-[acyl-carrier-protein] synthase family protein [Deltaproteobacteria bacterium]